MSDSPKYPSLYQINTRVWLRVLSRRLGEQVTLATVPDEEVEKLAALGVDWIWLLSVWQTSDAARMIARARPDLREEYRRVLPDLDENRDVCGSGFAISGYVVSEALGGPAALAAFRERLAKKGMKLLLDFVPNHTSPDHPWINSHPDYYVTGTEEDLQRTPANYVRVETTYGPRIFAHGRDPYFPGWPRAMRSPSRCRTPDSRRMVRPGAGPTVTPCWRCAPKERASRPAFARAARLQQPGLCRWRRNNPWWSSPAISTRRWRPS